MALLEDAARLYSDGLSERSIASVLGIDRYSVRKHLNQLGVRKRTKNEASSLRSSMAAEKAALAYKSGKSAAESAALSGTSKANVLRSLKKTGLIRDKHESHRRILVKNDAFRLCEPEYFEYICGIAMSDGNIHIRGESFLFSVCLKSKDIDVLEAIKGVCGGSIYGPDSKGINRFSIYSMDICNDLMEHGVLPRKTGSERTSDYMCGSRHFWRGVIDGDGSLTNGSGGRLKLSLSGSFSLLKQFTKFLKQSGIDCNQKPSRGNGNVYDITILGDRAVRVAEILYSDCRMRMRRKYDIYMSWIEMRDGGIKC